MRISHNRSRPYLSGYQKRMERMEWQQRCECWCDTFYQPPLASASASANATIQEIPQDAFRRWSFLVENNPKEPDCQDTLSKCCTRRSVGRIEQKGIPPLVLIDMKKKEKDNVDQELPNHIFPSSFILRWLMLPIIFILVGKMAFTGSRVWLKFRMFSHKNKGFSLGSIIFVVLATVAMQRIYKLTVAKQNPVVVTRPIADPKVYYRGHLLLMLLPPLITKLLGTVLAWLKSCLFPRACWIGALIVLAVGVKHLCSIFTRRKARASCKDVGVQVGNWGCDEPLDGGGNENGSPNELPQVGPKWATKSFVTEEELREVRAQIKPSQ